MLTNPFQVLVAACWLGGLAVAGAQVNVLPNGSFERYNAPGNITAWTPAYGGTATVVSNIATRCGSRVVRLDDDSNTNAAGLLSAEITVIPGATYTAGGYLSRPSTATPASLYLKFYDSGGEEVGSFSRTATAAANTWEFATVTGTAPGNAATARVLCYSTINSTGTMYFDGLFLHRNESEPPGQLVRYVSPTGSGAGTGANAANAAKYNQSSFWSGVNSSLISQPVRVIFLEGEYVINTSADRLVLSSIGNLNYRLTLEGERPYGTVFTRTDAAPDSGTDNSWVMVQVARSTNMVFRHLHWDSAITLPGKLVNYCLAVTSGSTGNAARDVAIEGCSFLNMNYNIYGGFGFHHRQTRGGRVSYCEFITGGYGSGFHMIYNAYGASDLLFEHNYFQDCAGSYLRLRAGCREATVRFNEFVSTAAFYNQPFIQWPTFNNIDPGDETWGYNFLVADNRFTYLVTGGAQRVALHLYHSGFDPERVPGVQWDYLLTPADAAILTSGSVAEKRTLIRRNFGLNFDTQIILTNNVRVGFHSTEMRLESRSNQSYNYQDANGVWHICPNYGGDGSYDVSDILTGIVPPTTQAWVTNASGNWDNPANWTDTIIPNAHGALGLLTNNITATRTVTLDTDVVLGALQLGARNAANPFVVAASGGSRLTFGNRGDSAQLIATTGHASDSISAPIVLLDDLTITNTKPLSISGVISELGGTSGWGGPRTLTKSGSGALTLTGANTFTGGLAIREGSVNGPGKIGSGGVTLGAISGGGDASLVGSGTYTNSITVAAGSAGVKTLRNAGSSASVTFSGSITLNGNAVLNAASGAAATTVSGTIAGNGGLTTSSATAAANYVVLSGANTFMGGVTLAGGPLRLAHNFALGSGPLIIQSGTLAASSSAARSVTNPVVVNGDFVLGQASTATGPLTLSGPMHLGAAIRTITVSNTGPNIISGDVAGPGGLTKAGPGTLILSGQNLFTGPTAVTNTGTLLVNGSLNSSAVTVRTGATLGGNGSLAGAVLIASGGRLAPGNNGVGTFTINNTLTLSAGSSCLIELNRTTGAHDAVMGLTAINYGGTLVVTNLGGSFQGGEAYPLFPPVAYTGKFAETNLPPLSAGLRWVWNPDTGVLTVAPPTATTLTNLVYHVNGDVLSLGWPESHRGWILQSNAVSVAEAAGWFDIPDSQSATRLTITNNPTIPNVFFRLRQP